MRRWLLVLMIALLPLRGWAGDAMALSMEATPHAAPAAAPCHGAPVRMVSAVMADHSHHAGTGAAAHGGGADTDNNPQKSTCNACDVCNGPAMALTLHNAGAQPPAHTHIAAASERFDSASPQRGHKPPIA